MPDETPARADLLPILIAPHKTLKTKARLVAAADMDRVHALVPRMFDAMYHAPGIGLAAPQIDIFAAARGHRFASGRQARAPGPDQS